MTKLGWIRIDLLVDEDHRYRVFGFDDLISTDDFIDAMIFIAEQMNNMEKANNLPETLNANNSKT